MTLPPNPTVQATITVKLLHPSSSALYSAERDHLLVRSFSLLPDGRDRKTLVPARSTRLVETGIKIVVPSRLAVYPDTPSNLRALQIDTRSLTEADSGLQILLMSYRHDSINIDHGTPIAILKFLPTELFLVKEIPFTGAAS